MEVRDEGWGLDRVIRRYASDQTPIRQTTVRWRGGSGPKQRASGRYGSVGEPDLQLMQDDATIKCWGYNAMGELGQGDTSSRGDGSDGGFPV